MKSGFFAAAAACSALLAAPASAQGVKIGVLNDQSGVYANYGGKYSVEAAKMAIEDFDGEVLGQKIELVTADHQNNPDLAFGIARRWYDADGVDTITELTTSTVALAVQELSNEKKTIDIVVGAGTTRITGDASALRLPLGLRQPRDRRYRRRAGEDGRRQLVLSNRRLRVRPPTGKGHQRDRYPCRRQGSRLGSRAAELSDFSCFLQAQNSKAKIVGLANDGQDANNSINQAAEFGIFRRVRSSPAC